uniref:Uncharacterized protein n=1 Tax=Trichuris muris TaxID=70415 RepID=A0A5S6QAH2_TRIMR
MPLRRLCATTPRWNESTPSTSRAQNEKRIGWVHQSWLENYLLLREKAGYTGIQGRQQRLCKIKPQLLEQRGRSLPKGNHLRTFSGKGGMQPAHNASVSGVINQPCQRAKPVPGRVNRATHDTQWSPAKVLKEETGFGRRPTIAPKRRAPGKTLLRFLEGQNLIVIGGHPAAFPQ